MLFFSLSPSRLLPWIVSRIRTSDSDDHNTRSEGVLDERPYRSSCTQASGAGIPESSLYFWSRKRSYPERIRFWALQLDNFINHPLSLIPALSISCTCIRWNYTADSARNVVALGSRDSLSFNAKNRRNNRTFLGRSANHLLCNDRTASRRQWPRSFSPIMKLLLQHSQRWRALQYNGDLSIGGHIPSDFRFIELQEINLQHYSGNLPEVFVLASKLHKIHALAMLFVIPFVLYLLSHITSLDTSVYSFDDLVDHCSNLTMLTLCAYKGRHNGSPTQNPRYLPHLLVLRLCLCSWADLEYILLSFSCPALTEVHVLMHLHKDLFRPWPHQLLHVSYSNFHARSRN